MTIDELLALAIEMTETAHSCAVGAGSLAHADTYAAIALSAATTAQAIILHQDTAAMKPAGHRHDGGYWIVCPFCADDIGGNCVACNGTLRIWEMPPEGAPCLWRGGGRRSNMEIKHGIDWYRYQTEQATARAEAAEAVLSQTQAERDEYRADAAECRAERARYGDMMTEKLATAEADNARLREQVAALTAEVQRLRPMVTDAHRSGMAGAERAWRDKVDEAETFRRVAEIERDDTREQVAALEAEVKRLRAVLAETREETG